MKTHRRYLASQVERDLKRKMVFVDGPRQVGKTTLARAPFGSPRVRAVRKEQKHYQIDWSLVPEDPARLENLVASHLLKWVHFQQDSEGRDLDLRYFRDTDGREVDFVVVERRQPILMVEAKWGDQDLDRALRYLSGKFPSVPAWQVSAVGRKDYVTPEGIRVSPALSLLATLV